MSEIKIAACYIRVSTDRQTELSPDAQINKCLDFAKRNGFIIPKEFIFRDDGISGTKADKRPEFQRMIAYAKQKPAPFEAVIVWEFSRFARNREESIMYKSLLRKNKIKVLSVKEYVDDSPFSSLIEALIEWMDEYYSINLAVEVKRGMTEKVMRGHPVAKSAYGYDVVNKNFVPNGNAENVRKMFQMYADGYNVKQLSAFLNDNGTLTATGKKWTSRTVKYILSNPVYIGKIQWNPSKKDGEDDSIIVDGHHQPIIEQDLFDCVQEKLRKSNLTYKPYKHYDIKEPYMLHGLVKCSACGKSLVMANRNVNLQCTGYLHGQCSESHSITIKKIDNIVLSCIEQCFESKTFHLSAKAERNQNCVDNSKQISTLKAKLKRIKEAYEDGVYSLEEYKQSRVSVEDKIKSLTDAENSSVLDEKQSLNNFINENKKLLSTLRSSKIDAKDKNDILSRFVDKIVFDRQNNSVDIYFYH